MDPVCGMEVDVTSARYVAEHDGRPYYFCGKGCQLEFQDGPETYLDPSYQPSM